MTFIAYSQPKSPEIWRALVKGFDAIEADPSWTPGRQRKLYENGTAILGGLAVDQPKLLQAARERRHPYIFVDNGYLATHENGKRARYRVVPDAYCHWWLNLNRTSAVAQARLGTFSLPIKPMRGTGSHVLVCTSSTSHEDFFGLKGWDSQVVAELKKHTDREIRVRRKGEMTPIEHDLADCWAVVAWSSKAAVDAVVAGIPVFVGPESPALPVAMRDSDLHAIERPRVTIDRRSWLISLAWGQFTVDEIAAGLAAELCREWAFARPKEIVVSRESPRPADAGRTREHAGLAGGGLRAGQN